MSPEQISIFGEEAARPPLYVPDPFRRLSSIPGMSEKARRLIDSIPSEKVRKDLLLSIESNFRRLEGFDLLATLVPVLEAFERKAGECCPICRFKPKTYRRRIRETLARDLVRLYRLGSGFFHIRDFTDGRNSSYFSVVELFGLATPKPNPNNPKRRTLGFWELSPVGIMFVEGRIRIPEFLLVESGEVVSSGPCSKLISDVIGEGFDYSDVLKVEK